MNPLLEFIKTQKPELAEVLTVIDSIQSMNENPNDIDDSQQTIDTEGVELDQDTDDKELIENTQLSRAKLKIKMLNEELEFQDYLIENLALALGACNQCFGLDDMCENCDGLGVPGYFIPESKPFNKVVAPAIRKMNLHIKN